MIWASSIESLSFLNDWYCALFRGPPECPVSWRAVRFSTSLLLCFSLYTVTTKQWADFIPYYLGPCAKWIWARDVLTSYPSSVCAVKMNSIINVNADLIRKVRVFVTYLWTRARFGLFSFNVWSSDFTCSHQGNR